MHECDVRIGYITVDMYTEHPPNYIYRIFAVCPIMSGGYLSPCEKAAHITPKAAIVRASLPPLLCPLPSANFSRVCGWCASGRRRGKEAAAEKGSEEEEDCNYASSPELPSYGGHGGGGSAFGGGGDGGGARRAP